MTPPPEAIAHVWLDPAAMAMAETPAQGMEKGERGWVEGNVDDTRHADAGECSAEEDSKDARQRYRCIESGYVGG